ncbi:hypothetical protein GCM10009754_16880 [Amycolatopsis minnesotensis]|uniref:Uncharacterized protein n=1 Tax=Amycolatopsis minnesotensis TaxID=337894 RepID=A0ABN2QC44_9PSEU
MQAAGGAGESVAGESDGPAGLDRLGRRGPVADRGGLSRVRRPGHPGDTDSHLRELVAASETHLEHSWPRFAIAALENLIKAARKAREAGLGTIRPSALKPLITQFIRAVHVGLFPHPPVQGRKQGATHRLLKRLRDGSAVIRAEP